MKRIVIDFIPQSEHRYATVGDYGETDDEIWFRITDFPDKPAYSEAILLHELEEFFQNRRLGIKTEDVDAFDLAHPELDDPGWDAAAPYKKTHAMGDAVERMHIVLSEEFWPEYDAAVARLFEDTP